MTGIFFIQKRDSGYDGESPIIAESKASEKVPSSSNAGPAKSAEEDGADSAKVEEVARSLLSSSSSVQEELQAVRRECEQLQARLASRDEDFTLLALQNKTVRKGRGETHGRGYACGHVWRLWILTADCVE